MRFALMLVLSFTLGSVGVAAQTTTPTTGPFKATSETLFISNPDALSFDGDLDKYGLIITFGIPSGSAFDWPVAVYNGTGKPIKNLRLKVYERIDGDRHPFDDSTWIYPMTIAPGEFGFGGADPEIDGQHLPGGPSEGIDAVFSGRPIDPDKNAADIVDVTIVSANNESSGSVTGVIKNENPDDIKSIEIHRLCIENSGVMTQVFTQILDQRLLKAGASTDFSVGMDPCKGSFVIASIAQKA